MEYFQIIVGSIIAIVSASVGWFLKQTEEYWNDKREQKRRVKSLISHLLEIFQLLVKSDLSKFTDAISDKLFAKFGESVTMDVQNEARSYYERAALGLFTSILEHDLQKVKQGYEQAVEQLSYVDPVRTYRLRGKEEIFRKIEIFSRFLESAKSDFPQDFANANPALEAILKAAKSELIKDSINELGTEIVDLAAMLNKKQNSEIVNTVQLIKRDRDTEIDKMIKDLFVLLEEKMPMPISTPTG